MDCKKNLLTITALIGIAGLIFIGTQFLTSEQPSTPAPQLVAEEMVTAKLASIMFDSGDDIDVVAGIPVTEGMSLYDLMVEAENMHELEIEFKDYGPEMGMFAESINGVKGGDDNKWWQIWVNNEYLQVGISQYEIEAGDAVLFKYTEGMF